MSSYYGPDFDALTNQDPEIAAILLSEMTRQQKNLQLIASENFTSRAVLAAIGSTLSNKYAEGYPGKRYYGGCEEVDKAESLAIERAKTLFGADHANVQPHSGASANIAVYQAFTKPKSTAKRYAKAKKAIPEIATMPAARPSMPSIKFTALIMTKTISTVTNWPILGGKVITPLMGSHKI